MLKDHLSEKKKDCIWLQGFHFIEALKLWVIVALHNSILNITILTFLLFYFIGDLLFDLMNWYVFIFSFLLVGRGENILQGNIDNKELPGLINTQSL